MSEQDWIKVRQLYEELNARVALHDKHDSTKLS